MQDQKPTDYFPRAFAHWWDFYAGVVYEAGTPLLAGIPIDQVSILLGHKSVKITEKHYAPFVKARQDQLTASVRQVWQAMEPEKPKPTKRTRQAPSTGPTLVYLNQHALGNT